jgi:tRNA-2-methylthio-N6-dimethylallyladenosine synthase
MEKKLYIKTYGCQMNVYDTVKMADVMAPLGYSTTDSHEDADMVILNTCHIREKAEEKVFSDLGRIRMEKERRAKEGKDTLIVVGGCVGQAAGEQIIARAPFVDMVVGPQTYHRLPEIVMKTKRDRDGIVDLEFPEITKFDSLPKVGKSQGVSAFLSVQEGCDKFCTFCVVPYTRGAEYSRTVAEIEEEAKQLVDQGSVEIMLLGQNVNAYHGDDEAGKTTSLSELIDRLAQIDGLERIRYTTSHPRDMDDDLIAIHGSEPKLMPYLHLPIQSGSDNILKAMNRKHKADFYLDIIECLRKARPDIAISSDFIVGFPGESDLDFEATMRVVETVGYIQAYSFKYSPRPGTPASTAAQVPEEAKNERLQRLQALLNKQQHFYNEQAVGKVMPVLFDRKGRLEGQLVGKNPYLQSVHLQDADAVKDSIIDVIITEAGPNSVRGEICRPSEKNVLTIKSVQI